MSIIIVIISVLLIHVLSTNQSIVHDQLYARCIIVNNKYALMKV